MKLNISPQAARHGAFLAAVAGMLCGLLASDTAPRGGAWLSALLGGALALLPVALAGRCAKRCPRLLAAALLPAMLLETASTAGWLAASAGFLAVDRARPAPLLLAALAALYWCATRGGDAVGSAAGIGLKLAPLPLAIVLLVQLPLYRPGWLFPLLGEGPAEILRAGIVAGERLATAYMVARLLCDGNGPAAPWLVRAGGCALAAAALAALAAMLTPMRTGVAAVPWQHRLDALLTNGRAPLYLQLPMVMLWFAGLLHRLAFLGFAAAALLQRLLPRMDGRACVGAVCLLALGLCAWRRFPEVEGILPLALWAVAAALPVALIPQRSEVHTHA